jgi:hypothetical protein
MWQALQAACDALLVGDTELAKVILEAADLWLVGRQLGDGVWDGLGAKYGVPVYCYVKPVNVVAVEEVKSKATETKQVQGQDVTVKCRLGTGQDITVTLPSTSPLSHLRSLVITSLPAETRSPEISSSETKWRYLVMGKIFGETESISTLLAHSRRLSQSSSPSSPLADGVLVIQIMLTPTI